MGRVTGIQKSTISYVFRTNPIIRQAVLELSVEVAEEAKSVLLRYLHKSAVSLVKLATGESSLGTADKMKVQLEAIKEHFNRINFAMPAVRGRGKEGDFVIRIEGPEANSLGLLISRRRELSEGKKGGDVDADRDSEDSEEEGEEGSGPRNDGSVAAGGDDVIEGKFTEEPA